MGQFRNAGQTEAIQVFANQVFDSFDIVLGLCFELGDPLDVGVTEIRGDIAQGDSVVRAQFGASKALVNQTNNPLNFDVDTGTIEARFGKVKPEVRDSRVVATIKWTEWLRGKGHVSILAVFSPSRGGAPPLHSVEFVPHMLPFVLAE